MLPIAVKTCVHDVTSIKHRTYMIERAGDSPPFWTTQITIETAKGYSHVVTLYHDDAEVVDK